MSLLTSSRLVRSGRIDFTLKAEDEMEQDGLEPEDVVQSILNADRIAKILRSTSPRRREAGERLYVIKSRGASGAIIYTKGAIRRLDDQEVFYVLISAKVATSRAE